MQKLRPSFCIIMQKLFCWIMQKLRLSFCKKIGGLAPNLFGWAYHYSMPCLISQAKPESMCLHNICVKMPTSVRQEAGRYFILYFIYRLFARCIGIVLLSPMFFSEFFYVDKVEYSAFLDAAGWHFVFIANAKQTGRVGEGNADLTPKVLLA